MSTTQYIILQLSDYCITRLTSSVRPLSLIICRNTSGGISFSLLVLKGCGSHGSKVLSKASLLITEHKNVSPIMVHNTFRSINDYKLNTLNYLQYNKMPMNDEKSLLKTHVNLNT